MKINVVQILALAILSVIFTIPEAHAMRWYSSSTGRWLSRDPIEESKSPQLSVGREASMYLIKQPGDLNTYSAMINDMINRVDPLGLASWEACKASAKFKIKINLHAEEGGSGNIDANLTIDLERSDCECICEYPTLKQKARSSRIRLDLFLDPNNYGHYLINSDWENDHINPSDAFPYTSAATDTPGQNNFVQPIFGYLVEAETWPECTRGSMTGAKIKKERFWGVEVVGAFTTTFPPKAKMFKRVWGGD